MSDKNKIQYGLRNTHYAILTNTSGALTWSEPKPWKGSKSLTLDPEGETSVYYADDTAYFSTNTNNGYTGSFEVSYLSDEILKDIFNYVESNDGMLVEDANAMPNEVALIFEFQGDQHATRHILYRVVFSRPSEEANTKENTIDPDTKSLDFTALPVEDNDHNWVKAKCPKDSAAYDTLFTKALTLPTIADE